MTSSESSIQIPVSDGWVRELFTQRFPSTTTRRVTTAPPLLSIWIPVAPLSWQ